MQWFSTGVPRNPSVLRASAKGSTARQKNKIKLEIWGKAQRESAGALSPIGEN